MSGTNWELLTVLSVDSFWRLLMISMIPCEISFRGCFSTGFQLSSILSAQGYFLSLTPWDVRKLSPAAVFDSISFVIPLPPRDASHNERGLFCACVSYAILTYSSFPICLNSICNRQLPTCQTANHFVPLAWATVVRPWLTVLVNSCSTTLLSDSACSWDGSLCVCVWVGLGSVPFMTVKAFSCWQPLAQ